MRISAIAWAMKDNSFRLGRRSSTGPPILDYGAPAVFPCGRHDEHHNHGLPRTKIAPRHLSRSHDSPPIDVVSLRLPPKSGHGSPPHSISVVMAQREQIAIR